MLSTTNYDEQLSIDSLSVLTNNEKNSVIIRNNDLTFKRVHDFTSFENVSLLVEDQQENKTLVVPFMGDEAKQLFIEVDESSDTKQTRYYNAHKELLCSVTDDTIVMTNMAFDFFKSTIQESGTYSAPFNFRVKTYPSKDTRNMRYMNATTLKYASTYDENVLFIEFNQLPKLAVVKDEEIVYKIDELNNVVSDTSQHEVYFRGGISIHEAKEQMKHHITSFITTVNNLCDLGNRVQIMSGYDDNVTYEMTAGDALNNIITQDDIANTVRWIRARSNMETRYQTYVAEFFFEKKGTVATVRKHMLRALCTTEALCDNAVRLRNMEQGRESITNALRD